ncbi:MAG: polynucleotide adenylyltransferase PcnB [Myxococcota bacterium]
MDLLVETLRIAREVKDWANARSRKTPAAEQTRLALDQAVSSLEAAARAKADSGEPSGVAQLAPLGPPQTAEPSTSEEDRRSRAAFPMDKLDPHAVSAIRRLRKAGYTAYLVGGCVRDLLLGLTPKDFDVSTDAKPEEVKAVFRNSRIIGRRFRLVHLYYRGGKIIEVATFRANAQNGDEEEEDLLIRRDNVFGTEEEDARRRDFTINGLFYDVAREKIIDHVGGLPDIQARYLRMIGDPDIRLREDPVRVLRAVRFAARSGLAVDPALEEGIRSHRHDLVRCAPARLLEELLKLLRAGFSEATVKKLVEWDVLPVLMPEIASFLESSTEAAGGDGSDPAENVARLFDHLRALDTVVRRGPVGDAAVIAALVMAPLSVLLDHAELHGADRLAVQAQFLDDFGRRISLTRRLQEQVRQVFQAQRHLGRAGGGARRRRRGSPSTLMQRPFFHDALVVYEIRCRALGLPLDEVLAWYKRGLQEGADLGPPPVVDSVHGEMQTVLSTEGSASRTSSGRRGGPPRDHRSRLNGRASPGTANVLDSTEGSTDRHALSAEEAGQRRESESKPDGKARRRRKRRPITPSIATPRGPEG